MNEFTMKNTFQMGSMVCPATHKNTYMCLFLKLFVCHQCRNDEHHEEECNTHLLLERDVAPLKNHKMAAIVNVELSRDTKLSPRAIKEIEDFTQPSRDILKEVVMDMLVPLGQKGKVGVHGFHRGFIVRKEDEEMVWNAVDAVFGDGSHRDGSHVQDTNVHSQIQMNCQMRMDSKERWDEQLRCNRPDIIKEIKVLNMWDKHEEIQQIDVVVSAAKDIRDPNPKMANLAKTKRAKAIHVHHTEAQERMEEMEEIGDDVIKNTSPKNQRDEYRKQMADTAKIGDIVVLEADHETEHYHMFKVTQEICVVKKNENVTCQTFGTVFEEGARVIKGNYLEKVKAKGYEYYLDVEKVGVVADLWVRRVVKGEDEKKIGKVLVDDAGTMWLNLYKKTHKEFMVCTRNITEDEEE